MTTQEQQMLQGLTDRINNTPLAEKDPEAEQYLQQTLGRNLDALYILAQTVLVQQYALDQAQKQLADARAQLDQVSRQQQQPPPPRHATSFLGNLLGLSDDGQRQAPPPPPQQYAPAYPSSQYAPVNYTPGPSSFGPPPSQSGGFLRSAMQTATGVAAGAFAFEGIESLMHGFGHEGGGSGFEGGRPEEVVNNYYGDSSGAGHNEHLSSDIEDRRGDSRSFDDAVTNDDHGNDADTSDSESFVDDSSMDDSSSDDGSSYDSGDNS